MKTRFPELDSLRGLAIVAMVIFHWYLLQWWTGLAPLPTNNSWQWLGDAIGVTFLMVSGASAQLALGRESGDRKWWSRIIKLGICALIITWVSWLLIPRASIYFGVIHLLTVGAVVLWLLRKVNIKIVVILGLVLLGGGLILYGQTFPFWWGLTLGLTPATLVTLDYYPLVPWLGWVLMGWVVGKILYPQHSRQKNWQKIITNLSDSKLKKYLSRPLKLLVMIGQRSLLIYMLHVPILLVLLLLLSRGKLL